MSVATAVCLLALGVAHGLPSSHDGIVPESTLVEIKTHETSNQLYSDEDFVPAVKDDIAGIIDDDEDYRDPNFHAKDEADHQVWDPQLGMHRVKSPGYVDGDAELHPDGKYSIGSGRRRIGAGFGRRRAPVRIAGSLEGAGKNISDIMKDFESHPDAIHQLEKYAPSPATASKATLPPMTQEEKESLVREIMGLHNGPTFYEFCNGKGEFANSVESIRDSHHQEHFLKGTASVGSLHIPAGWCVTLYSKNDFEGHSKTFCGKMDEECLHDYRFQVTYGNSVQGHTRMRNWMHPYSIKVEKHEYMLHEPTDKCPTECGYKGGFIEGPITCHQMHGGEAQHDVNVSKCEALGLTKPTALRKHCDATRPCAEFVQCPSDESSMACPENCGQPATTLAGKLCCVEKKPDALKCEPKMTLYTGQIDPSALSDDNFEAIINDAINTPTLGYCKKDMGVLGFSDQIGYSNHGTCGGLKTNVGYKLVAEFWAGKPGNWSFDLNVDFGLGGVVLFDGKRSHEGFQPGDHWWAGELNRSLAVDVTQYLEEGPHVMEIYGAEDCCDGISHIRVKPPAEECVDDDDAVSIATDGVMTSCSEAAPFCAVHDPVAIQHCKKTCNECEGYHVMDLESVTLPSCNHLEPAKMDICLMLDGSGSVEFKSRGGTAHKCKHAGKEWDAVTEACPNWGEEIKLMETFTSAFSGFLSKDKVQVHASSFSDGPIQDYFTFGQHIVDGRLAVEYLRGNASFHFPSGKTHTLDAIKHCTQKLQGTSSRTVNDHGSKRVVDAGCRKDARKVIVLLTDGEPNPGSQGPEKYLEELKGTGIHIIIVSIGSKWLSKQALDRMENWASMHSNYFSVSNFDISEMVAPLVVNAVDTDAAYLVWLEGLKKVGFSDFLKKKSTEQNVVPLEKCINQGIPLPQPSSVQCPATSPCPTPPPTAPKRRRRGGNRVTRRRRSQRRSGGRSRRRRCRI